MTVFGSAGSMGLMLVGFGIQDSISDIATIQYRDLQHYDGMVIEDSDSTEKEREELADFILNGISFFIAMAIATIVLHLISQIFRIVSRIPVLRGVNRYFGMVIGAIYGILIIWIGFYMIAICGNSEIGMQLLSYIYENTFLTYLYENNLIIFIMQLVF